MEENKQIYSYHTFLFPFLLKNGMTKEKFCETLDSADSLWETADMIVDNGKRLAAVESNELKEALLDYQTFQYFNPSARKALFEADSGIVSSYSLKHAKNGIYEVQYGGKTYSLNIDAIRLKVFNTGVAVIAFELEYWIEKGQEIQARQDIKIINEFGRRLYPEFLGKKDGAFLLCADCITVKLKDMEDVTTRFRENAIMDSEKAAVDNAYLQDPIQLPEIITELTGVPQEDIEPAIDDRMFVCCCILDAKYADYFLGHDAWPIEDGVEYWHWPEEQKAAYDNRFRQQPKWRFMTDWKAGCELYALTNIDESAPSCQNRILLNQYFEEQLYLRWIENGTIHAVTNHSMVCLTSPSVMDSVVNPFLIVYVPMCILCLAQRASLLSFDDKITETIHSAQGQPGTIEGRMLEQLIELEEDFAIFQGQLLLQEITPQIQGIELYERLQKMLFIEKLETGVQRQLNNLYEIAESKLTKQQEQERLRKAEEEKKREEKQREEQEEKARLEQQERDEADQKTHRQELFLSVLAILGIFSAWVDLTDYIEKWFYPQELSFAIIGFVIVVIIVVVFAVIIFKKSGKKR